MHDPKVSYRSVFGIEQNPPQWKIAFERANEGLPSELVKALEPAWRMASELPMPHVKLEKWRWLDFSQIDLAEAQVWTEPVFNLFIEYVPDGKEAPKREQGLPQGLLITTFRDALQHHPELIARLLQRLDRLSTDKFQNLAEALGREGLFVFVPRGVKLKELAIANLQGEIKPGMNVLRSLIWLEPSAELKLVLNVQSESTSTTESLFHLAKTDIVLEDDARLHFTDVSIFEQEVTNLCYHQARLGRGAQLDWIYDACATSKVKQSVEVDLEGEGAEAEVRGVYFPAEGQKVSVDTVQKHLAPHTKSNLLFRGAAIGDGEAIWRGMIYVDPVAQKTDGYQSNQNLILGERSEIKSIPGLEICADDVSCSHGATVGRIDETELFYLQARGIHLAEAEQLIVEGFFAEVIERIPDEKTRNRLGERLIKKFEAS